MRTLLVTVATVTMIILGAACGDTTDENSSATPTSEANADTQRLWIEPDLVDCEGVGPQKCMKVAMSADGEPQLFYDGIEGFVFEPGNSYVLDVTVEQVDNPPADGSSLRYVLVEVVDTQPAS